MRIPVNLNERAALYMQIVQRCDFTRSKRHSNYQTLKAYYLYGSQNGAWAKENKIYSHCDLLTSFIYSGESVRFTIEPNRDAFDIDQDKLRIASEYVGERWYDGDADSACTQAVTLGLVYGSTFVKMNRKGWGNVDYYYCSPSNIGVLNEAAVHNKRQEAICHWYTIPRSQLVRTLTTHPHGLAMLEQISFGQKPPEGETPPALNQNIWMTSLSPNIVGSAPTSFAQDFSYAATVMEDSVQMKELWLWDDGLNNGKGDYRVVTLADPFIPIFDRPNIFVPQENPFIKFTPNPLADYYYGISEVAMLTPLQDVCERRFEQIRLLWDKQADPPHWMNGFSGLQDEKSFALRRPGGLLANSMPTGTVTQLKPDLPPETFAEDQMMEEKFNKMGGITNIMMGRGETGVRSKGQTQDLSKLASARVKRRAINIERSLDELGTKTLKVGMQDDPTSYQTSTGEKFTLGQMNENVRVRVDAHSSSPLFVEDHKAEAFQMLQAKIIDRKTYVEIAKPMSQDLILKRLPAIEMAEKQAAERQFQLQMAKFHQQHPGGRPAIEHQA